MHIRRPISDLTYVETLMLDDDIYIYYSCSILCVEIGNKTIYRQLDVKNISFYRMIISCTKIIIVVHEITPQKEISLKRNCT